ncbi:hypothetical protein [Kineococcus sp. SYSU DK005]|uniref:hypothetical protein n=1 Tax=Kineococcus sp. SYSU DK005 TaxID=3383126 RepID=UPI003D7ED7A5
MSHHDPTHGGIHDGIHDGAARCADGVDEATAHRLRSGLETAGRDVRAPAGIVTAALRGGRRRRRQRRAAIASPIAAVALGALVLSWAQPWSGGQVRTVPAAGQAREGQRAAAGIDDVLAQLPLPEQSGPDLGVAQQVLIDRCLAAQGLDVDRARLTLDAADPIANAATRSRDVDELEAWSAHGFDYGVSASLRAVLHEPGAGQLGEYLHGIPAGYREALDGDPAQELTVPSGQGGSLTVPTTGCHGQALEQLYGTDVATYARTHVAVRALPEQLLQQVSADDALSAPLRTWSQCMHARGYQVSTPADLPVQLQTERRDLLLDKPDGTTATESDLSAFAGAEGQLAAADRDCKDTSALAPAFAKALVRHWAPMAAEHAEDLAAYREMLQHARRVAVEVNPR